MDPSFDLALSLQRARARRDIARILSGLTPDAARDVLLGLYAEYEVDRGPPEPDRGADAPRAPQPSQARTPQTAAYFTAPRSRPRDGTAAPSFTARLIETLRAHPQMAISDIAQHIYGKSDRAAQGKTRSLLSALKHRGDVVNVGEGLWELAKKETPDMQP